MLLRLIVATTVPCAVLASTGEAGAARAANPILAGMPFFSPAWLAAGIIASLAIAFQATRRK